MPVLTPGRSLRSFARVASSPSTLSRSARPSATSRSCSTAVRAPQRAPKPNCREIPARAVLLVFPETDTATSPQPSPSRSPTRVTARPETVLSARASHHGAVAGSPQWARTRPISSASRPSTTSAPLVVAPPARPTRRSSFPSPFTSPALATTAPKPSLRAVPPVATVSRGMSQKRSRAGPSGRERYTRTMPRLAWAVVGMVVPSRRRHASVASLATSRWVTQSLPPELAVGSPTARSARPSPLKSSTATAAPRAPVRSCQRRALLRLPSLATTSTTPTRARKPAARAGVAPIMGTGGECVPVEPRATSPLPPPRSGPMAMPVPVRSPAANTGSASSRRDDQCVAHSVEGAGSTSHTALPAKPFCVLRYADHTASPAAPPRRGSAATRAPRNSPASPRSVDAGVGTAEPESDVRLKRYSTPLVALSPAPPTR